MALPTRILEYFLDKLFRVFRVFRGFSVRQFKELALQSSG